MSIVNIEGICGSNHWLGQPHNNWCFGEMCHYHLKVVYQVVVYKWMFDYT